MALKVKLSLSLPWFRDLPANPRTTHSHREGWHLLSPLLPECGQFQRGPGGAPSDEEGVWECCCGSTGPGGSQAQLSASPSGVTSSVPTERDAGQKCGGYLSRFDWTWPNKEETFNVNFTDWCWVHGDGQADGDPQFYLLSHYCCTWLEILYLQFNFVTCILISYKVIFMLDLCTLFMLDPLCNLQTVWWEKNQHFLVSSATYIFGDTCAFYQCQH